MPSQTTTRIGPLDCVVVDGGESPSRAVVLCHGFGAPGTDLVGIASEWIGLLGDDASDVRFVFPAAPHDLTAMGMPGGRAWWHINMEQMLELAQAERYDELHEREPPDIDCARGALYDTVKAIKDDLQGDQTPIAMGGFSQGSMVAMDVSLRTDLAPPDLLFLMSSTVICREAWSLALPRLSGTKVFQSHGTFDPILPFTSAVVLQEMLSGAGIDIEFHSFAGMHGIDPTSIEMTAEMIRAWSATK